MTNFTLAIQFEPADLETIVLTGQLLTIVNQVSTIVTNADHIAKATSTDHVAKLAAGALPNEIAWLAFTPFVDNVVSWSDDYDLYALRAMDNVIATTSAPGVDTRTILFDGSGFGKPLENSVLPEGVYGIANHFTDAPYVTFGMANRTSPMINGASVYGPSLPRMNAAIVPKQQTARFTPTNSLQVFLQTSTFNGMPLSNPIHVPALQFGEGKTKITIKYNSGTASFDVLG